MNRYSRYPHRNRIKGSHARSEVELDDDSPPRPFPISSGPAVLIFHLPLFLLKFWSEISLVWLNGETGTRMKAFEGSRVVVESDQDYIHAFLSLLFRDSDTLECAFFRTCLLSTRFLPTRLFRLIHRSLKASLV